MPFQLGKRTNSIQSRNGDAALHRTISLPADDDALPAPTLSPHQRYGRQSGETSNRKIASQEGGSAGPSSQDNRVAIADGLPLPAIAPSNQKLKFKSGQRLKVSFSRVTRKLAAGSTPSASLTGSYDGSSDRGSAGGSQPNFPGYHLRRKRRRQTDRPSQASEGRASQDDLDVADRSEQEDDEVNITVVDNDLFKNSQEEHDNAQTPGGNGNHIRPDDASDDATNADRHGAHGSEMTDSVYQKHGLGPWGILRWRIWPVVYNFFDLSFREADREKSFQKEQWWNGKLLCLISSCYLVLNWVLYVGLTPKPNIYDKVMYYLVGPILSVPTPIFAAFNVPRKANLFWQIWIMLNVYFWSISQIVNQHVCGFYTSNNQCGGLDFVGQGYYTVGLPILALFALGSQRIYIFVGSVAYTVLVSVLIIPLRGKFARNLVNFIVFIWIFLILSYLRESMDRRISILRDQLKLQYKATQKAQIAERKSNNSKRRFVSYIFHEVRVPLNTALLALQTLESMGIFKKSATKDCEIEYTALQGSLGMMSKVLNDVLDMNRMESGRLEHVASSFDFHAALKSMLGALRVATSAKNLDLKVNLDSRIDQIARIAAARECSDQEKCPILKDMPALVIGDEMRLRQVVTNLASNACKFTPEGGTITINTQLIYPQDPVFRLASRPSLSGLRQRSSAGQTVQSERPKRRRSSTGSYTAPVTQVPLPKSVLKGLDEKPEDALSRQSLELSGHSPYSKYSENEIIVVRIEVEDTGVGIRPKDMVDGRLFSAYVQTEIGKKQGGKGTGLGLALVRSIVQLSGGRLGVKSRTNHGSCFWVELPFAIGKPAVDKSRKQPGGFDGTMTGNAASPAPMVISTPKFLTVDGVALPLRPVAPLGISFTHTDSSYSNISNRSDYGNPATSPVDNIHEGHERSEPTFTDGTSLQADDTVTAVQSLPSAQASAGETGAGDGRKRKALEVLVVDDDPLTRLLMTRTVMRLVKDREVATYQAENGQAALQFLLGHKDRDGKPLKEAKLVDCVFCDNSMPIMTGPQMIAELRRHGRKDLVVGVTGNALKEDQEDFENAGVDYVLTKPVPASALQQMLELAVHRQSVEDLEIESSARELYSKTGALATNM